jgi:NADPH-dependent curcumin reductase CurA
MIGGYGEDKLVLPKPMRVVIKSIRLRGFTSFEFDDRRDEFHRDMLRWTLSGELDSTETVHERIESVPAAFLELFSGGNLGKMLVRLPA